MPTWTGCVFNQDVIIFLFNHHLNDKMKSKIYITVTIILLRCFMTS